MLLALAGIGCSEPPKPCVAIPVDQLATDVRGTYVLSIATSLSDSQPIRLRCDLGFADPGAAANWPADLHCQPLTISDGEDVGDEFVVSARMIGGTSAVFVDASFGAVKIPGEANASSWDIEIDAMLFGHLVPSTDLCGTITGAVTQPEPLSFEGSWNATRVASCAEGAALPTIASACPSAQ